MESDEDLERYSMMTKRFYRTLTAVKGPTTEQHFEEIIVQSLSTIYNGPALNITKNPGYVRHLSQDHLYPNQGKVWAYRGAWHGHIGGIST